MPIESGLQHCHGGDWQSQQSSRALVQARDVLFFRPQMPPCGLQPRGLRHTPSAGDTLLASWQVTLPAPGRPLVGSPPQQSLSLLHRLLVTRQPLAGWQIFTPVRAKGRHRALQQLVQSPHTVPSLAQLPAPVVDSSSHTPAAPVLLVWQRPEQQSLQR